MRASEIIGDHLYQLNLMLWMLQPSTGAIVKPLLAAAGFSLKYIEVELPFPVELKNRLQADEVEASDPVTPDIVMSHASDGFVLVECKKTMFGGVQEGEKPSSQVKQARALLLHVPEVLASALPGLKKSDIPRASLVYLARHDPSVRQTLGLEETEQHLRKKNYRTVAFGLFGLSVQENAVMICNAESRDLPPCLRGIAAKQAVEVQRLGSEDTDPRPLYIVPWMPGSSNEIDDYGHAAFGNRLLSEVAAIIGPVSPPCSVRLEVDPLLDRVTQGHYGQWRSKSVRRALRDNAKKLIKSVLEKASDNITLALVGDPSTGWELSITDEKTKNEVIKGLQKWQAEKWNKPLQASLFDKLGQEEE